MNDNQTHNIDIKLAVLDQKIEGISRGVDELKDKVDAHHEFILKMQGQNKTKDSIISWIGRVSIPILIFISGIVLAYDLTKVH